MKKIKPASDRTAVRAAGGARARVHPPATADVAETAGKLEEYLAVARGEINRLDYIVTQFLHAIRPAVPQLKPVSA